MADRVRETVEQNKHMKTKADEGETVKTTLMIAVVLLALLALAIPATAQDNNENSSGSPAEPDLYLGQKPPGAKAEIFAPDVLKDEPHDTPVISRDETWIIIGAMGKGILFYKMTAGNLSLTTNPLGFDIPVVCNGVVVSPSENRVYIREWKDGRGYLYYIDRKGDDWTVPKYEEIDSFGRTWQFTATMNEDLYFSSDRILVSVFDGDSHLKPVSLKLEDNSDMLGTSPYISPDESYIIYSIDYNLHISYNLHNGIWTTPLDLGPNINSEQYDHCPQISPNGKYLFFISRRDGPDWVTYWADAGFVEDLKPERLK